MIEFVMKYKDVHVKLEKCFKILRKKLKKLGHEEMILKTGAYALI